MAKPKFHFTHFNEMLCIDLLKNCHKGKENAIIHQRLAETLGITKIQSWALINHLVLDHNIPIAGTSDAGIFYIEKREEFEQNVAELIARIDSISKRISALKKAYYDTYGDELKLF